MDLSHVIIGQVFTEKSERLKGIRTYTLQVASSATKVEVGKALERLYDIEVQHVRLMRVPPKVRQTGQAKKIVKRKSWKKVLVTLKEKSKALDLAAFRTK